MLWQPDQHRRWLQSVNWKPACLPREVRWSYLPHRIEAFDPGLAIHIHLDTTAHIMGCRHHRDPVLGYVYAQGQHIFL